jgi:hypothetical protein
MAANQDEFAFKKVVDKESLKRLFGKLVKNFWYTLVIEQMKARDSYVRLFAYEEEFERWKYLVASLFNDLIEPDAFGDEEYEFDSFQFFFMKYLQNIADAIGMDDGKFLNFCTLILAKIQQDKDTVKLGLMELNTWFAEQLETLKNDYLATVTEEKQCTVQAFDKYMEKTVLSLSKKSIDETPLQRIHAHIYLSVITYFTPEYQQESVRGRIKKQLHI